MPLKNPVAASPYTHRPSFSSSSTSTSSSSSVSPSRSSRDTDVRSTGASVDSRPLARPTLRQRTSSKSFTPAAAATILGGLPSASAGGAGDTDATSTPTFASLPRRGRMMGAHSAIEEMEFEAGNVGAAGERSDNMHEGQLGEGEEGIPRSISTLSTRPPVTLLSSTPASASEYNIRNVGVTADLGEYQPTTPPTPLTPNAFQYHQPYPSTSSGPGPIPYDMPKQYSPSSLPRHLYNAHPHTLPYTSLTSSRRNSCDSELSLAEEGEATPLLRSLARSSGLSVSHSRRGADDGGAGEEQGQEGSWYEGPLFVAGVKLALLFMLFTAVVVGTFWFGMPPVDPQDRDTIKLPRSFADLQALNALFEKYKRQYPLSLLSCGVVSYLFVQTFSLPGSMYISILFGAAYGMLWGLFLSCLCESIGSVFCYFLSATLAPPLLTIPFYRARVEQWRAKIMGSPNGTASWVDIGAFLLVLRITPFPPHWVCNVVSPHLGISVFLFWATCFVGIAPVSVIHVTIGSSLDSMTSADDLHVLSVRNVLGLIAVVVAVMIPVGLKRVFKKDLGALGEEVVEEVLVEEVEDGERSEISHQHHVDGYGSTEVYRYHAVDSGVVLAGPSAGDEDYHPDDDVDMAISGKGRGMDKVKGNGKGKGRMGGRERLQIIADIREEDEDQAMDGADQVEQMGREQSAPLVATLAEKRSKRERQSRMQRTYGAVDN